MIYPNESQPILFGCSLLWLSLTSGSLAHCLCISFIRTSNKFQIIQKLRRSSRDRIATKRNRTKFSVAFARFVHDKNCNLVVLTMRSHLCHHQAKIQRNYRNFVARHKHKKTCRHSTNQSFAGFFVRLIQMQITFFRSPFWLCVDNDWMELFLLLLSIC